MRKTKILLAMSGGTDSSAAAVMLHEQGYDVQGLFISFFNSNWASPQVIAQQQESLNTAAEVCSALSIPFHHVDASQKFYTTVIEYFVQEYVAARTPFPCAICNPRLKWQILYDYSIDLQCDCIATGHYVSVEKRTDLYYISQGIDPDKDQSFFLWGLAQHLLSRTIFPLGSFTKKQVREYAYNKGFTTISQRKDSLGICFLGNSNYRPFLVQELAKRNITIPRGNHINEQGEIIAPNEGYTWYTVGQRKQLGIALNTRLFVKCINAQDNTVTLSPYISLFRTQFIVHSYYFHSPTDMQGDLTVKIRYRNQEHSCNITDIGEKTCTVQLHTPLEAIAPGQTAVFYKDTRVVGGGFIQ